MLPSRRLNKTARTYFAIIAAAAAAVVAFRIPNEKNGCESTSSELSSCDKVGIYTTTKSISCGSNSPLKITDDPGKYATETYSSNEVLALPLPGSPGVHDSLDNSISSGASSSFTSEKSRCLDSPLDFISPKCDSLSNMSITVPVAVASGDSAKMTCTYDLESDPLYAVKWYKGRQEFFRYVPKELPHTRVFPWPGINVDVSQSGPNQVVLRDVKRHLSGKYRCEVSADAPSFHTKIVSSWMHVVYPPVGQPVLSLEKRHYTIGDTLKGNCTSPPSSPPSNVTWYLNDKWMNSSYGRSSTSSGLPASDDAWRSTTTVGLELEVNSFKVGKMRIRCVAELYGVFKTSAETVLDEEKPRLASILGTFSSTGASHTTSYSLLIVILVSVWMR